MEVMNSLEFEQQNVLIGRTGKTKNFGVSDDPMLMSMLSTGLYANPLRTMLQEIMFNAWDAHRMGNCQDKPIDVYLNETTGLIVRDYGPGIDPDELEAVYCIYGNSTKRQDDGQTGGFGLGSKSPFAYNDSFMVANHFQGKKSMYVVNRVCDENNGGPGMTPIIEDIDTEESGLVVTVPMKTERDIIRSYEYIKDILFLSGIKINIHLENQEVETIEAQSMTPHEYINADNDGSSIWAVYGGVRYKILYDDAYSVEYEFIRKIARTLGSFYIGFPPNSLTPLPNREGLNLSDKTVETIKSQLETMQDAFMKVCKPACRAAMEGCMKILSETGIQPQFLAYRWKNLGNSAPMIKIVNDVLVLTSAIDQKPDGIGDSLWISMVMMAFKHTDEMSNLIGHDTFNTMRGIVFVKQYPKWIKRLNYLTDRSSHRSRYDTDMGEHEMPNFVMEMNKTLTKLQDATGQKLQLRMETGHGSKWNVVSSLRRGGKGSSRATSRQKEEIKRQLSLGKLKTPKRKTIIDRIWCHGSGNEVKTIMLRKHIIIAKSVTALNDTTFRLMKYFAPGVDLATTKWTHYHSYHSANFCWQDNITYIPAIVIHKKKDGYIIAKQTLENMGYIVIEADEPEIKVKEVDILASEFIGPMQPVVREKPTFPIVDYRSSDWVDYSADEVENPQCYFCCTMSRINNYRYNKEKPSKPLLQSFVKRVPRTVILHNKRREPVLIRMNVPTLAERVDQEVKKLLKDNARIRIMYLHMFVHEEAELPALILAIPEMQKMFRIPYIRTNQKETFARDWQFLQAVQNERSHNFIYQTTKELIKNTLSSHEDDPSVSLVRKMCDRTKYFDKRRLNDLTQYMKPGEKKMLSQKIARFLRTV